MGRGGINEIVRSEEQPWVHFTSITVPRRLSTLHPDVRSSAPPRVKHRFRKAIFSLSRPAGFF